MYDDDTFHDTDNTDITTITHNINTELSRIVTWRTQNKLLINTSKTKMTDSICHRNMFYTQQLDEEIEIVNNFTFLGIIMKLTSHTESIANTITKYTGVINGLKQNLPLHILRTLYNTLILPHLYYGLLLWEHYNTRLHKLQIRTIRAITRSKCNAHTEPLHKTLNILKLPDMYNLHMYTLFKTSLLLFSMFTAVKEYVCSVILSLVSLASSWISLDIARLYEGQCQSSSGSACPACQKM